MKRTSIFSVILAAIATFLLFWWPLSHWLYYDWYNSLLGFTFPATHDGLVKMIGTCGLMPVFALYALALRPRDNGPLVILLSAFSLCLAMTFAFLVARGDFPRLELMNAAMTCGLAVFLPVMYLWARKDTKR